MTTRATRSLLLRLRQAEAQVLERLQPSLDEVDLSADHWRVLAVLLEAPASTMSALGQQAVVPAASLTRLVDRLVERGLVHRHADPLDGRRVAVTLSVLGERLARRLEAEERAASAAVADPFPTATSARHDVVTSLK